VVDDWVTVIPAPSDVADTARALLALADSPHDVRTAAGGTEFRVPPYLADRYTTPDEPAAAPKRRRAKKEDGEE
jgi:hypothetical protein